VIEAPLLGLVAGFIGRAIVPNEGASLRCAPRTARVLIPLFEEDGLRMSDVAHRARLSKQTMTTLVRPCERDGLVTRRPAPDDGRAARVHLTQRARASRPAAERVLAELEATVVAQLGERRATDLPRSIREVSGLATAART
jgi:DNA-binding MarR family transcriptional regulator